MQSHVVDLNCGLKVHGIGGSYSVLQGISLGQSTPYFSERYDQISASKSYSHYMVENRMGGA